MPLKHKKTILIVEDEKPIAKALELKFAHEGYAVTTVENGEAALKIVKAKNTAPDLILLDLIMPKMNGFVFLEELQKHKLHIPVIISSNLSQEEDMKRAQSFGVIDYYVKSNITIAQVVEKVRNYFDK